ncbi:DUF1284 domain-containing protein [Roseibium sp. RKSG952]|uniref:DUF1284 domain-containing protein n=1 Tax=Roseibium sp. RKSG952 TaxID=2529384 RepID=UPI0012BC4D08|nr:DUF1284 domain-containing protein [Roseibium sp. RKSG952]MTH97999.1 DUF1284 domain-containing protein [Roseibium sp. RKSG952]
MTIRLRAHHLLCMLTYAGKGYSPAFVANYTRIVRRLSQGEKAVLVSGPDDICAPELGTSACHCLNDSVRERDRLARHDIEEQLRRRIEPGPRFTLAAADISHLREAFADGQIRTACAGCEWHELCSGIASSGYAGCQLFPAPRK